MKHTRIIQTSVTLAALLVGSACSATISASPATGTIDVAALESPTTAPSLADEPATTAEPEVVAAVTHVAEAPTTSAAPSTPPVAREDPASAPVPEPAPEPADPTPFELTKFPVKVDPTRPTPLPRPDLGLAFAPCGAFGPVSDTASAVSTVLVEALGDGTADDTFTSYLDGGAWTLRLTTSNGTISEYDVAGVGPGFVEALGAVQLDGEQGDQLLAVVGSNASNLRIGAFGADKKGCIVRFTDTGGTDVEFGVGGNIGQLNGVACDTWNGAGYLESLSAVDMGGGSYNVYGTTWHNVGANVLEAESGTHMFGLSFGEAEFVSQLDCPGITL